MKLVKDTAQIFIYDNKPTGEAINRTTHMSIAAHQDDIEIMSYDGILTCFNNPDKWFFGVVLTDGLGSPRGEAYKKYTNVQMMNIRNEEQKKAALIGQYGALALLSYSSNEVKDNQNFEIVDELLKLLKMAKPEIVYTHNLADKHDTHVGVTIKVIKALRKMDKQDRPHKVYGCEVWRSLDWLLDEEKVSFNVSEQPELALNLIKTFQSQLLGAKRYDLATIGRRMANATFGNAQIIDKSDQISLAMDLTPLIIDDDLDIIEYVLKYIENFKTDVYNKISKMI